MTIPTEKVLLTVEASGAIVVPKTGLGQVTLPEGDLPLLLFQIYAVPLIERTTDLDKCKFVTSSQPGDPDKITGRMEVTATVLCRLGPNKVKVREVVTFGMEPVVP